MGNPPMTEYGWGHDPEPPEDSASINQKLLALLFFAGSGGATFAVHFWMFGGDAFSPLMCGLAAVVGAVMLAYYCRREELPMWAALIAGPIAGAGTYGSTALWVFGRQSVYIIELAIPLSIGAIPGIIVFIVLVRMHYRTLDE
jgi:hypothetical protein